MTQKNGYIEKCERESKFKMELFKHVDRVKHARAGIDTADGFRKRP